MILSIGTRVAVQPEAIGICYRRLRLGGIVLDLDDIWHFDRTFGDEMKPAEGVIVDTDHKTSMRDPKNTTTVYFSALNRAVHYVDGCARRHIRALDD